MLKAIFVDTTIPIPIVGSNCTDVTNCNFISLIISRVTLIFFFVVGVVLIGMIIYAGFLYMSDGGNEENAKKSRKVITSAVIGLFIIGLAGVILKFFEAILGVSLGI